MDEEERPPASRVEQCCCCSLTVTLIQDDTLRHSVGFEISTMGGRVRSSLQRFSESVTAAAGCGGEAFHSSAREQRGQ